MTDMILHHYAMSPFSQKVRSMLGHAQSPWRSVIHPASPPRPALALLAGGYRKMPVAQIGADIFCDTRVIAEEIAERTGHPELVLGRTSPEAQALAARADLELFFACCASAGSAAMFRKARAAMGARGLLRFGWDRLDIGRRAKVRGISKRPRETVLAHAADLEARLTQDFLFGPRPVHADFSVFHGLSMIHFLGESTMLHAFPRLVAWLDRMIALGEGTPSPLDAAEAIAIARRATPRAIPSEHRVDAAIGSAVSIAPTDYARDATIGTLAGATPTRWIIAREPADVGVVHVHFPRTGYSLR